MATQYSVAEARARFPTLLRQAERGVHVELTRRGEPVAVLVSTHEFERLQGRQRSFKEAYERFIARHDLSDVGLDADFVSSLRDRSPGRDVYL